MELLQIEGGAELNQIDYTDQELRGFLAQKHPAWLQEIVDRQVNHWQLHKPEKFFRLAPDKLASRDITSCVMESPHAALERFQLLHLNKTQLALCLVACPKAAVMFATDKIPPLKRNDYLLEHPKEAIVFAADKLSDDELQLVSSLDIFTAYRCREDAPPHRRAIMLACSYMIGLVSNVDLPFSALHEEIKKSLLEHPRAWLSTNSNGFPAIFKDLERFALMPCSHTLIGELLDRLDPEDSNSLSEYIGTVL